MGPVLTALLASSFVLSGYALADSGTTSSSAANSHNSYTYFSNYCAQCHGKGGMMDLKINTPADLNGGANASMILAQLQGGSMPPGQEAWDQAKKDQWKLDKSHFIDSLTGKSSTAVASSAPKTSDADSKQETGAPCPSDTADLKHQVGVAPEPVKALIKPILASHFAGQAPDEYAAHPKSDVPNTCDETKIRDEIRKTYQTQVKAIFSNKCFDCHNSLQKPPIDAFDGLGGRLNVVEDHIADGQKAMDMVADYPFMSTVRGQQPAPSLVKQSVLIEGIGKSVENGTMPLPMYTDFHRSKVLTDDEKKTIENWSKDSLAKMACLENAENNSAASKTPAGKVKQLFEQKCVLCHSDPSAMIGVATDLKHLSTSRFIDRANPEQSLLYQQVLSTSKMQMPPGSPLTQDQISEILTWIKSGAPAQ
jgi:mono/diheme cytochrome c family protein